MGTRKLATELRTFVGSQDGEELLFYRMARLTVDGISSEFYGPTGGEVHMAPMISLKNEYYFTGDGWSWDISNGGVLDEELWIREGDVRFI